MPRLRQLHPRRRHNPLSRALRNRGHRAGADARQRFVPQSKYSGPGQTSELLRDYRYVDTEVDFRDLQECHLQTMVLKDSHAVQHHPRARNLERSLHGREIQCGRRKGARKTQQEPEHHEAAAIEQIEPGQQVSYKSECVRICACAVRRRAGSQLHFFEEVEPEFSLLARKSHPT